MKFLGCLLFLLAWPSFSQGRLFSFSFLKLFKARAVDIIDKAVPKDECSRHLKAWIGDLFNIKKMWALNMFDASAKIQTGYLTGNIGHWGNFDQCLKISENKGDLGVIEGQYCSVALLPVKNASSDISQFLDFVTFIPDVMGVEEGKELRHLLKYFRTIFGLCLPKSCSVDNLQALWNYIETTFRLPFHVLLNSNFCNHKGQVPHTFYFDKYIFWIFGVFFGIICLASIYDLTVCHNIKENMLYYWEKLFISFSIPKNLKSIFHYPEPGSDNGFGCISGLKVISMVWVVFGHRYTFGYITGVINMLDYFQWKKTVEALVILLAPFAVDTFLTISGLLLAYKYLEMRNLLPPKTPFPYFMFYFLRFLRLWPALLATIMVYTSVLKYLNSGPLWTIYMFKVAVPCAHTGWLSALFMTNFVKFHYQCVEPTWYLAVDTQLYCIAPLLLYFLYKYPKKITAFLVVLCVYSALHSYMVTVEKKEKWTPQEGDDNYHMTIYQSTFVRMPSWILGLLAGTLLYSYPQIHISKVLKAFIWITVTVIFFGIARATNVMAGTLYNEYSAGIYNAIARPLWSLAICIVVCMCATGNGGLVNRILSFNIYKVIVKLSYSIYLVHIAVITLVSGNKRTTSYHSFFSSFHAFLGDLPFIFIVSLIWCLAFESPFLNVAKLLVKSKEGLNLNMNLKKTLKEPNCKEIVKYVPTKRILKHKTQ